MVSNCSRVITVSQDAGVVDSLFRCGQKPLIVITGAFIAVAGTEVSDDESDEAGAEFFCASLTGATPIRAAPDAGFDPVLTWPQARHPPSKQSRHNKRFIADPPKVLRLKENLPHKKDREAAWVPPVPVRFAKVRGFQPLKLGLKRARFPKRKG
jgi:hypothetical protein